MAKRIIKVTRREYLFKSKELKDLLKLEGEVKSMDLYEGRSPNDVEEGVSSDEEWWSISTEEKEECEIDKESTDEEGAES